MTVSFSEGEKLELVRLLRKVARNGGWFPNKETVDAANEAVSRWATELVICRSNLNKREIFLSVYNGGEKFFLGKWHIPGGYSLIGDVDIQATCSRVAKRELNQDVKYVKILYTEKWLPGEHPHGAPLSLFVLVETSGEMEESDKSRFFSSENLPDNLVEGPHRRFIEKFLSKEISC